MTYFIVSEKFTGILYAIGTLVCIGIFAVPQKFKAVRAAKLNPTIFFVYFDIGILIVSLITIIYLYVRGDTFDWTIYGVASGAMGMASCLSSIVAIPLIGLSLAQSSWHGIAIITGFVAGTLVEQQPRELIPCIFAIIGLIFGITLIIFCRDFGTYLEILLTKQQENNNQNIYHLNLDNDDNIDINNGRQTVSPRQIHENRYSIGGDIPEEPTRKNTLLTISRKRWCSGVMACLLTGLFGGWMLIPENWADSNSSNLKFIPSFGMGMFLIGELLIALYWTLIKKQWPKFEYKTCMIPGIVSGIIWNCANILNVYSIEYLTYAIAFPIRQCGIIIAALFGVFVFGEISNKMTIIVLFIGEIIVIGMQVLLVIYGS